MLTLDRKNCEMFARFWGILLVLEAGAHPLLGALRLLREQRVDEAEELHDALVLPQVLVPLEQERVLLPVAPEDGHLPRPLLGGDDFDGGREAADAHHSVAVRLAVCARHRQLEVVRPQKLRRHVLQLMYWRVGELDSIKLERVNCQESCELANNRQQVTFGRKQNN